MEYFLSLQYIDSKKDLDKERNIEEFVETMHKRMNPKNLRLYVNAYLRLAFCYTLRRMWIWGTEGGGCRGESLPMKSKSVAHNH